MAYRLAVQNRRVRGVSLASQAVRELCERRVIQDEKKRWKVERKLDMKARSKHSPDRADSRVLALQAARSIGFDAPKSLAEKEQPRQHTIWMGDDQKKSTYRQQHRPHRTYASR